MRKVFSNLRVKWKSMLERCSDFFDLEDADEVSDQRKADKKQDRYGLRSPPFSYDRRGNKIIHDNKIKKEV